MEKCSDDKVSSGCYKVMVDLKLDRSVNDETQNAISNLADHYYLPNFVNYSERKYKTTHFTVGYSLYPLHTF